MGSLQIPRAALLALIATNSNPPYKRPATSGPFWLYLALWTRAIVYREISPYKDLALYIDDFWSVTGGYFQDPGGHLREIVWKPDWRPDKD